ncbi:MFS transporter [Flavobacteriales bacterium]|nr:MFS transporter [Flavobacteriales bacterium]
MFLSKLKNKKEVISWSLYDFANQPFTTIIVTFVYGAFFTEYIANDKQTGTLLWTSAIAITAVVVSVLSPILGALADKGGYRKLFLMFFTWVCAIFSILLYFPVAGDVYFALSLFVVANVAFEMGSVFCNSYLPDISKEDNIGKISGFGWGLGFVGGLSALFLSLHLFPTLDSEGIRRINILVGVWFLIFSIPTFLFVKDRKSEKLQKRHIINSFKSLKNTFNEVVKYKTILNFLVARLFFNDGLVTIFSLGGIYAMGTLNFSFDEVLILGIVLNVAAGIGSFVFGYLEDEIGVKNVINISLLVLIFSTLLAYFAPETSNPKQLFWVAGVFIGLMVGPNQSCSRSLMAQLIPSKKQNEFFGFFALTGKATSFLGPLLFGIIAKFYSQQLALWVVILFFIIGLFLFNRINFKQE